MRWYHAGALVLVLGCNGAAADKAAIAAVPTFEIRGFKVEATKSSPGTAYEGTSFHHKGTIVAHGDSALTKQAYLVLVKVTRISGGDPENPTESESWATVVDGVGDLTIYDGYRSAGDKWDTPKLRVQVIGAVPVRGLESAAVEN